MPNNCLAVPASGEQHNWESGNKKRWITHHSVSICRFLSICCGLYFRWPWKNPPELSNHPKVFHFWTICWGNIFTQSWRFNQRNKGLWPGFAIKNWEPTKIWSGSMDRWIDGIFEAVEDFWSGTPRKPLQKGVQILLHKAWDLGEMFGTSHGPWMGCGITCPARSKVPNSFCGLLSEVGISPLRFPIRVLNWSSWGPTWGCQPPKPS